MLSQKEEFGRMAATCCCCRLSVFICYFLSFLNLISAVMKMPFIVLMSRMAYEQISSKLHPHVVPTLEPMYEEEIDPQQAAVGEQIKSEWNVLMPYIFIHFLQHFQDRL